MLFLIEDEDGEKFGYYLNTEVVEKYKEWKETDNKSFEFNLQSNGRLQQPMKFEIIDIKRGGYYLCEKSAYYLISLGDITLFKGNWKNYSHCYQFGNNFDYHGIKNALCGKTHQSNFLIIIGTPNQWGITNPFTLKRLIVIQMK